MAILSVQNLRRRFGDIKAVDGVSFEIEAGEVFGLLGPNGAGKSTIINTIVNIVRPDSGQVLLNGGATPDEDAYKRRVGYVPQDISLAMRLSARENLAFFGRLYDLRGGELKSRIEKLLEDVGLRERGDDIVSTYSGGMKRRLNIACALLHEPDLILMDEPTVGVDPQARAFIFEIVNRLADAGRAILYTTHYMEEAQRLCRRTAIIDRGQILAIGTLVELTQQAGTKAGLVVEGENLTTEHATALSERLGRLHWELHNGEVHFSLRDERVSISRIAAMADEMGVRLRAVRLDEPNLETVFLELTGRALRD